MKRYNKLSIKKINTTNIKDFAKAEAIPYTSDSTDYYIKRLKMLADPKRALALADKDKIIGTANSFSEYISLPKNKSSKVAAVSYVSVQPTHRRQGILSEMMKLQLNQIYSDYKEPLAILWPSETAIYGRFGYAPTREKHYKISKHNTQFTPGINDNPLEIKILNKKEAINSYVEINNNLMNERPGVMKLTKKWAERRIEDLSSKYLSTGPSYFVGVFGSSSILCLAIVTSFDISSEISSSEGPICLQGPHHSAQKSTTIGFEDFITSLSKFSSVTFTVAIMNSIYL